jgi:hypothetical protein
MNKSTKAISANQLVAHNLRRARESYLGTGATQEQAAVLLEEFLGERWSKTSWSNAERSAVTEYAREFSANEILAFARTFSVPVSYFFEPPDDGMPLTVFCGRRDGDANKNTSRAALLSAINASEFFNKAIARVVRQQMDLLDPPKKEK